MSCGIYTPQPPLRCTPRTYLEHRQGTQLAGVDEVKERPQLGQPVGGKVDPQGLSGAC
jgi:hypothetical protein